ncbi:putative toxin-antitoxin system toxin component, PIN family [Desulfonatronum thioautotrophicum]|uniref:putative toxin-antitoxin system toxin component, PIN family n=1 Tax=Desulfonatronum thioautotrophicum TaxID=617001 RepID=UPI0005EBAD13|nr:putative toxin-antitoxin system toxin component, PIN family [Desulfonatronum thioautotrophicum]
MIVVMDTNVLVSGMINPHGPPGRLVDLLRSGDLRVAVDDRILAEYVNVLHRPRLSRYFVSSDLTQIMDYLRSGSMHVLVRQHIRGLPDQSDAPFLEVAIAANVPLITGNVRHYPDEWRRECTVLAPAVFLDGLVDG